MGAAAAGGGGSGPGDTYSDPVAMHKSSQQNFIVYVEMLRATGAVEVHGPATRTN